MHIDYDIRPSGHPIHSLAAALGARVARLRDRRKIRTLRDLDDHLLNDVGLARGDVERVLSLPLSADAATELHRVALERSRARR